MPPIRVLILSDDALARAGLAAILSEQDGIEVAAQVTASADLRDALELYAPDVIVGKATRGDARKAMRPLACILRYLTLVNDEILKTFRPAQYRQWKR